MLPAVIKMDLAMHIFIPEHFSGTTHWWMLQELSSTDESFFKSLVNHCPSFIPQVTSFQWYMIFRAIKSKRLGVTKSPMTHLKLVRCFHLSQTLTRVTIYLSFPHVGNVLNLCFLKKMHESIEYTVTFRICLILFGRRTLFLNQIKLRKSAAVIYRN